MLSHLATLAVAFVLLVKAADYLVEYGGRLARRFNASELLIGLVMTSVGTSLPELSASIAAALAGSSGIVIGNVVGSNIANIGLVLGTAAVIHPFATQPKMYDRDGYILLASVVLLLVFALDNRIGRLEAGLFLVIYVAYVIFVARSDQDEIEYRFKDFLKFVFDFEYAQPVLRRLGRQRTKPEERPARSGEPVPGLLRESLMVAGSLIAMILGARFVVSEAIWLARLLEVPENLIGLSLVALGTSLPELMVGISAARRGNAQMVVGNVIGSNIANGLLIVGAAGLIRPLDVPELSVVYSVPIMLFFSLAFLHFVRTDWKVTRAQGALALFAYAGFLVAAFLQGWS